MTPRKKVLITSCFAKGGVVSMRNMAARFLLEGGVDVDFASYAPYQLFKNLSVPIWQLGSKHPAIVMQENHWWVGTWLPEWEFMRSKPSPRWREIISQYEHHMVVSGTAMAAHPFLEYGLKPLCWLATRYWDERSLQVKNYPVARKIMSVVDKHECEKQEKKVLDSCPILSLGSYTKSRFLELAPQASLDLLPMPIDSKEFYPVANRTLSAHKRIGFCGRLDDPRKNIAFLLQAFHFLKKEMSEVRLVLAGGQLSNVCQKLLIELDLVQDVEVIPFLPKNQLLEFYHSLDLFVIPSLQEGLGIVGLEAMACGLPVVSTRCGGPQDFVFEGVNGHLVNFEEYELCNAMVDILSDENRWRKMGNLAIEIIQEDFSYQTVCETFWEHFNRILQTTKHKSNKAA